MGRKRKYEIKNFFPFEATSSVKDCGGGKKHRFTDKSGKEQTDTTTMLTYSMMISDAFKDLTARQRMLYVYAKSQFYGARSRPHTVHKDIKDFEEYNGQRYFYLNHKLMSDVFNLYPKSNHRDLYKDIATLVDHGFIEWYTEPKSVSQSNHMRAIYRYSEAWKEWKPGMVHIKCSDQWKWEKIQNPCDNMSQGKG